MAAVVKNNMTTETNAGADAATGWTVSSGATPYTDTYREASASLGFGTSAGDDDAYITITSTNFGSPPGRTLFGWMQNGVPGSPAAIGFGLLLGDGTNDRVYSVGGNTNYGSIVNGWSGFRLDGEQAINITNHRNITGSGSPDTSAITRIGYGMNYAITARGKVDTTFIDILRHIGNGDPALSIAGGSPGDLGTWADIVADDQSTADGKAYGVCRVLVPESKAYELNYGIEFGSPSSSNTYFEDSGFQLIINGKDMTVGNMDVSLVAGSGTNWFYLEDSVIASTGAASSWDMSAAFENFKFNGMACTDLGTITFPSSGGTLRESTNCTFTNCGQVSIGTNFTFTGHLFNGSSDATGALLLDNAADDTNMSDLTFISDGTGHAIYITATGDYTFTNMTFTGYGSPETTNSAIYNNSGGTVNISVTGGSSPTVRNGASAVTNVTQTVTLKVTSKDGNAAAVGSPVVRIENSSTGALISQGTANASGVYTDSSYNYTGDVAVTIKVRKSSAGTRYFPVRTAGTITSNGLDQTVTLTVDNIVT